MNKPAIISITDALGADFICDRLGVSRHSIRYARTDGLFPASWYAPLKSACDERGVDCPIDAFNWKSPAEHQSSEAQA